MSKLVLMLLFPVLIQCTGNRNSFYSQDQEYILIKSYDTKRLLKYINTNSDKIDIISQTVCEKRKTCTLIRRKNNVPLVEYHEPPQPLSF